MNSLRSLSSGSQTRVLSPSHPTIEKPPSLVLSQHEKPSLKGRVDSLVQEMLNCELFSDQQRGSIIAWKREASLYLNQNDSGKTTLALASLLIDTIRPASCEGKDKCLDFEEALVEILDPLLPPGQSVDEFLEEVEEEDVDRAIMEEKLRRLDFLQQEEMRTVCNEGNQKTQEILQTFKELKEKLASANAERRSMVREAHQEFDRLTREAEDSCKKLNEQAHEAERLGEEMLKETEDLRRLLAEARELKV